MNHQLPPTITEEAKVCAMYNRGWVQLGQRLAFVIVLIAVGAAILIIKQQGGELLQAGIQLNVPLVVLSFLIACAGLAIAIPLWRRLLTYYGIRQPWQDDLRLYCYSALGAVLPGSIWTIVSRSVLYRRLGSSGTRVAAAGVIEALLIGVAAAGVYGIASLFYPGMHFWQRPELGVPVLGLTLVLLHPKVFNLIVLAVLTRTGHLQEQVIPSFRVQDLFVWVLLEALMVVIGGTALFVLLLSFVKVKMAIWIGVVAAWAAASVAGNLFFWLPGTAILRDGVLVLAVSSSLNLPTAVLFAVLARVWSALSLLIVAGIIWLWLDLPVRVRRWRGNSTG